MQLFAHFLQEMYSKSRIYGTKYNKFYRRQPLKNFKGHGQLKQTISLEILKGSLPQNLLSPLLNTFFLANVFSYADEIDRNEINISCANNI